MKKNNTFLAFLLIASILFLQSCSGGSSNSGSPAPTEKMTPPAEDQALEPIQKQKTLFSKFGSAQKFEWVPAGYSQGFVYDIYYYIPTSIIKTKNSPALVFMHGGGASTVTREGANKAVNSYIKEVIAAAEKYKFIAVLPSSNGLNWGGHTEGIMAGLAQLLRAHLNFDTNRLGLSGHSMGGMGITRTFTRVVNDYSFVNAVSAGMNDTTQTIDRLKKMYNITYSHQLGTKDSFDVFITWMKALEQNVKNMETNLNKKSLFQMEWFDDAHVYTPAQTQKLKTLFEGQRNIFQKNLYGQIYFDQTSYTENNITYAVTGSKRYLWVENIPTTVMDNFQFETKVQNNRVYFDFYKDANGDFVYPKNRKFKLYLSSKMFDLSKDINIYLEGYFVVKYHRPLAEDRTPGLIDKDDPNSAYDDVFEFKF